MSKSKGRGSGYAVGHGKPPKHTQFKPGQSGNPKGKPKGKLPTMTLISKQLEAKLTVTIAGQPKQMTRREALITALIRDARQGNERARRQVFDLLLLMEASASAEPQAATSTEEDAALIEAYLKRHAAAPATKKSTKRKAETSESGT